MSKKYIFHIVMGLIIVILLYICERSWMFEENVLDASDKISSIIPLGLFVICFIYKKPLWNVTDEYIVKALSLFYFFVIFLTYFHSLAYPLNARLDYITIPLPLILFYSTKKIALHVKEEYITYAFVVVAVLLGGYYYSIYQSNFFNGLRTMAAYTILFFLPFILCLEKPILKYAGIILCLIILMASLKRGGLISFVLSVLTYLYIVFIYLNRTKYRFLGIAAIVVVAYSLIYVYDIVSSQNDSQLTERLAKLSVDGGSERSDIFLYSLKMCLSSDPLSFLFGHGYDAVIRDSNYRLSAHNDFIEILYDYGFVTFVFYIIFIISLFRYSKILYKNRSKYLAPWAASIVIFMFNSNVSHIFLYPRFMSIFAVFWGFVVGASAKHIFSLKRRLISKDNTQ